ncbi:MAG: DUF1361 domain-containing protein [Microcoleaceae cyanobacterium]
MMDLINWIRSAGQLVLSNVGWMSWNLFLALIPAALSFWLFQHTSSVRVRLGRSSSLSWMIWLLLGVTVLPNVRPLMWRLTHLFKLLNEPYFLLITWITSALMVWELWQWRNRRHTRSRTHSLFWWLGSLTFIFFLPNAPYVLTDVIHLIQQIRQDYSVWVITLALIPQYLLFMGIGFGAYVLSLINLNCYLKEQGWSQPQWLVEWIIHGLCAIGIYLGRFQRFNSWDILTQPRIVLDSVQENFLNERPLVVITVTFIVLLVLYGILKPLTLAMLPTNLMQLSHNPETSDVGDVT